MTTSREALTSASDYLSSVGLDFPSDDAALIVATVTGASRAQLISSPERRLDPEEELLLWRWLGKRARHFPIQYLRGFQEFYGYEFLVSSHVLVPRPETELLIEVGLELLGSKSPASVLDVGTGSGCIAATLLLELPTLSAVATDISESALKIAEANARRNKCSDRLLLLHGDTVEPLIGTSDQFDLVISNPPYVALHEKASVSTSVLRFEPTEAVFAGDTGLEIFERLFAQASPLLAPGGNLLLELGCGQGAAVKALGQTYGWELEEMHKDLAGIERCGVFRPL